MLHLDLFGPVNVLSISKKRYALVIVDEYTRFTWVYILFQKDETPEIIFEHVKLMENKSAHKVKILRRDNGTEFKNAQMIDFCKLKGITQQFSEPGTPQQNGVVERKNRTLIEAGRTMLEEASLPTYFVGRRCEYCLFQSELHSHQQAWSNPVSVTKREET